MTKLNFTCLVFIFFLGVVSSRFEFENYELQGEDNVQKLYKKWKLYHGVPENDQDDRFDVFKANSEYVYKTNMEQTSYRVTLNKFANLTDEEFSHRFRCTKPKKKPQNLKMGYIKRMSDNKNQLLPKSVDWRLKGAVTPVKNQGEVCGACWAFAVTAAVEGYAIIVFGTLYPFSEQELLDCSGAGNCTEGYITLAFDYVRRKGVTFDYLYPYTAVKGICEAAERSRGQGISITGYINVERNNEAALREAVALQPVAVIVDGTALDSYDGGVIRGDHFKKLNHALTIVGYGIEGGEKFWIVKNLWGSNWGEEGYARLARDIADPRGQCGIAMHAEYPF